MQHHTTTLNIILQLLTSHCNFQQPTATCNICSPLVTIYISRQQQEAAWCDWEWQMITYSHIQQQIASHHNTQPHVVSNSTRQHQQMTTICSTMQLTMANDNIHPHIATDNITHTYTHTFSRHSLWTTNFFRHLEYILIFLIQVHTSTLSLNHTHRHTHKHTHTHIHTHTYTHTCTHTH